MKQLHDLEIKVKAIIAQNSELKDNISLFMQETDALSAKMIALAQENAELTQKNVELSEKVAALAQTNAALSIQFDDAQTQAIQGIDAQVERDAMEASLNQLIASLDSAQRRDVA